MDKRESAREQQSASHWFEYNLQPPTLEGCIMGCGWWMPKKMAIQTRQEHQRGLMDACMYHDPLHRKTNLSPKKQRQETNDTSQPL